MKRILKRETQPTPAAAPSTAHAITATAHLVPDVYHFKVYITIVNDATTPSETVPAPSETVPATPQAQQTIRRFSAKSGTTLGQFRQLIQEDVLGLSATGNTSITIHVAYKDADGDVVAVTSELEWAEAITQHTFANVAGSAKTMSFLIDVVQSPYSHLRESVGTQSASVPSSEAMTQAAAEVAEAASVTMPEEAPTPSVVFSQTDVPLQGEEEPTRQASSDPLPGTDEEEDATTPNDDHESVSSYASAEELTPAEEVVDESAAPQTDAEKAAEGADNDPISTEQQQPRSAPENVSHPSAAADQQQPFHFGLHSVMNPFQAASATVGWLSQAHEELTRHLRHTVVEAASVSSEPATATASAATASPSPAPAPSSPYAYPSATTDGYPASRAAYPPQFDASALRPSSAGSTQQSSPPLYATSGPYPYPCHSRADTTQNRVFPFGLFNAARHARCRRQGIEISSDEANTAAFPLPTRAGFRHRAAAPSASVEDTFETRYMASLETEAQRSLFRRYMGRHSVHTDPQPSSTTEPHAAASSTPAAPTADAAQDDVATLLAICPSATAQQAQSALERYHGQVYRAANYLMDTVAAQ